MGRCCVLLLLMLLLASARSVDALMFQSANVSSQWVCRGGFWLTPLKKKSKKKLPRFVWRNKVFIVHIARPS
eukprot:COSAG04_NODE_12423_length_653_cov_1.388087_2_plen_72_part_00